MLLLIVNKTNTTYSVVYVGASFKSLYESIYVRMPMEARKLVSVYGHF